MLGKRASPVRREAVRKGPLWHLAGGPPYRTPGLAGGPGKPTGSNPGRAPQSDPTAICLLAYIFLAVAAAFQRARDEDAGILELIPVTIPELAEGNDLQLP